MAAVPQDPNWPPGTSQLRAGRGAAAAPPVPGATPSVAATYGGAAPSPLRAIAAPPSGNTGGATGATGGGATGSWAAAKPSFMDTYNDTENNYQAGEAGMTPATQKQAAASISAAGAAPAPAPAAPDVRDNISQSNLAAANSLLPQGMRRFGDSQIPGVYSYRAKDGSLGFTDASGLNNPAVLNGVDPRGLRRSDTNVASFANTGSTASGVDPSPLYGPNDTVQGSGYQENHGLPQANGNNKAQGDNLFALMSGQASDKNGNATGAMAPNANRALPASSLRALGVDTSPQALSSMNTYQLGDLQKQLSGISTKGDPDQAAANNGLLARINARQQDLAKGALGKPGGYGQEGAGAAPTMFGPLGGAGAGGAGGLKTLLGFSKAAEQVRHNQALEGVEGANSASEAQSRDTATGLKYRTAYAAATAPGADPGAGADAVAAQIPQGMRPKQAAAYFGTATGAAAKANLLAELQKSAMAEQHPWEFYDKGKIPQEGFGDANFDGGKFSGLEYGSTDPTFGFGKYDPQVKKLMDEYGPGLKRGEY